ncbi:retron system putative HNH endonuclease [Candidatus Rariloculus sp.]|uniref:retron system putative HNH endonuclease n=1 Tax=Candidatus Rariloculus sp. TaxID=3101265 RepID=UPI003D111BDD
MKRICFLPETPPGLAAYLNIPGDNQSWDEFRSFESGGAYNEIRAELVSLQHGLCGYCEIRLIRWQVQIEHVIPQSAGGAEGGAALDSANMMACCLGGTKPVYPVADPTYHRALVKFNMSCGQAKGSDVDTQFLDPRMLPALPSLFRVLTSGEIEADSTACESAGFPVVNVHRTIEILGLNVRRLVRARQSKWRNLSDVYAGDLDDRGSEAARAELALDEDGSLPPFFTTARSFFGPFSETALDEPPREWI